MSYFAKFPLTTYTLLDKTSVVKDIFRRASFLSEYKPYTDLYLVHTIEDGETVESLAAKYYGSAFYHWVIYIFNEIHNPSFDWPMGSGRLERVGIDLYGDDLYSVKHFVQNDIVIGEIKEYVSGVIWVPPENPFPLAIDVYPVTFFTYLDQNNDAKRDIRILRPELLGDFVSQFGTTINV